MATRLPYTVPESLKIVTPEPSPLAKARVHERKAEELRKDDDSPLFRQLLERMRSLEFAAQQIAVRTASEYRGYLGKDDVKPYELLGHLIATLPRARMDLLFKDPRIGELNVLISKRDLNRLIGDNEMLQEMGLDFQVFLNARRDLRFQLGLNTYRSGQALGVYFTIVRAAADPKVKKTVNLVQDEAILTLADGILRDVTTHVLDEMRIKNETFLDVADRRAGAEQARQARMPPPKSDAAATNTTTNKGGGPVNKAAGPAGKPVGKPAAGPAKPAIKPGSSKPPPGGRKA